MFLTTSYELKFPTFLEHTASSPPQKELMEGGSKIELYSTRDFVLRGLDFYHFTDYTFGITLISISIGCLYSETRQTLVWIISQSDYEIIICHLFP